MMKGRTKLSVLGAVVLALAVVVVPTGAQADHILPGTPVAAFTVTSDGAAHFQVLPGGIYNVTVTGTYIYDRVTTPEPLGAHPDHFADAECSQDSLLYWDGVVDQVAHDFLSLGYGNLYPTPLSEWQRYRYGVRVREPFPTFGPTPPSPIDLPIEFYTPTNFLNDTLDVYINDSAQAWIPTSPSLTEPPGIVAGCNLNPDHKYESVLVHFGGAVKFHIFDTNYVDNPQPGGLQVVVEQIL